MLESLMNNSVAWFILSLISVISFVFAIYTWIVGKRRKEISISDISHVIIKAGKSQIPKLNIMYDGVDIDNLTATKIYIWNSGNEVINSSDVVESKKISIHSGEGADILDAQILNAIEPSNKICITNITPKQVVIEFDYIDHGEGCLVQLLHTGSAEALGCSGKIKGGKEIRCCYETGKKTVPVVSGIESIINRVLDVLSVFLVPLAGVLATKLGDVLELDYQYWPGVLGLWAIYLVLVCGVYFIFKLLQRKYNKSFHRDVPSELKKDF